ncbi:RNA polymerase sigma factor [Salinimicrobium terrae]|uniref:RNA polymerase sigma factor n=1 Tax=Salinimicrobium terrae TaxID=470866 RepID=UPI0005607E5D|nr:RNA polymerase sigma factor [Salinimicrobium terrae]
MGLKELVRLCKKQDRKAQEKLYRDYSEKLFVLCLKYSGNYEQAKDLLQDSFIKIFQNIEQFAGKGSFEGWMTRIVINTAIKKSKKNGIFLSITGDISEENEENLDDALLSLDFLIKIIQELPEAYRMVFNLYVMENYSHKEIAQMLGISEGTSKSNLARARIKLRERVRQYNRANSLKSI